MFQDAGASTAQLVVGQKVYGSIRSQFGFIYAVHGKQSPETVQDIFVLGEPCMVTGGNAEFDIVFENGTTASRLPEAILRGVQWRIYDEVIDQLSLKRLLNHVKEVEAENAVKKSQAILDRASLTESLKVKYSHLLRVDQEKYNGRIIATKNIRTELKVVFPAVKFSVTSETFSMGDAIRISWTDGPTTAEVDAITKKYQAGSFDGMTDCYNYGNDPFNDLFGDAKYVTVSRDESFAFAAQIVEQYNQDYGVNCTVKASVYDGLVSPHVSHYEGDNGKMYCQGARDTHGEQIRRLIHNTACTEILFSEWKAPKEALPAKKTTASKVDETLAAFKLEIVRDVQFCNRSGEVRDDFRAVEVQSTQERAFPIRFVLIGKKGAIYALQNCFNKASGKSDSPQMYVTSLSARLGSKTPFDHVRFVFENDQLRYR